MVTTLKYIAFLIGIVVCMSACDSQKVSPNKLKGVWDIEKFAHAPYESYDAYRNAIDGPDEVQIIDADGTTTGTYEFTDEELIISLKVNSETYTYTYTLDMDGRQSWFGTEDDQGYYAQILIDEMDGKNLVLASENLGVQVNLIYLKKQ
ncbi:MAG: hypothetical protein JXQ90_02080 [Cyclobacteriaceae bacterium]